MEWNAMQQNTMEWKGWEWNGIQEKWGRMDKTEWNRIQQNRMDKIQTNGMV